jgi:hypothetical protein
MLCSMIIPCSDYPHLHCLDAMLSGPIVTMLWPDLRMQREKTAANTVNKQLRTADKEWASSLGVGMGLTAFHCKK